DPREFRICKKNGKLIWVKSTPSLMTMRGKKYIHWIGTDITESKKRKRKLKINKFAIDHTSIEVFWINHKGEFEYVNKAACENLGYNYEELTNMSVPDIDPVHHSQIYKQTWEKMKNDGTYTFETKHKSRDGRIYPVRVSINYLNYHGKELSIAFAIDLTEQKKAKERLKASEEKYRLLFRNSPYSIFLINMEGKILDCNQATVDLLGFPREEIIGSSHRELAIHPEENINTFIKRFVKLIKGESVEPMETQLYTKDKKLIWVHIRSSLIKIDNDYYIQTIIQNIDKRKRAESELRKLNKIKSELLKRTSHELKTPLVSIKGFTNLLTEFYSHEFNEDIMSYIGEIKYACNRLEDLIKDILQTSKLKSGDKVIQKSEVNLTKLIRRIVDQLKGFIKLRNHQLKMDLSQKMIIKCEKQKIADVISNLLSNAIKYTPSNGLIKIKSTLEDGYAVISIQDSGIGLTESEKEKIFTQFGKIERYGQGFDVVSEGSGLGLYISKKIIELHNGEIWVESEGRNKGSTFYFSLPIVN
ncbi:MAG: PAS domain-containing sensor histidine kinase, partial [Promethearchaeota archaeon]